MSTAPRIVTPKHRVNDYTVVIPKGAEDGVSEGDDFMLQIDGEPVSGTATDVGKTEAVLELSRVDVESYI